jgi:SpoVK/Ycf46/Vps4 family AAA+-type ATPase
MKLFDKIKEFVEYGDQLIFVLIDEVESLAHTRQVSMNGSEPSDAIRVVNALLTQIDCIKNYPNVVILTTSNVTNAIDLAFVDRADIKQYIGLPTVEAIYEIYRSCIQELVKSSIVSYSNESILTYNQVKCCAQLAQTFPANYKLMEIAKQSLSLSGRSLRKIPFLAIALFSGGQIPIKFTDFLEYLSKAVTKQFEDRKDLNSD